MSVFRDDFYWKNGRTSRKKSYALVGEIEQFCFERNFNDNSYYYIDQCEFKTKAKLIETVYQKEKIHEIVGYLRIPKLGKEIKERFDVADYWEMLNQLTAWGVIKEYKIDEQKLLGIMLDMEKILGISVPEILECGGKKEGLKVLLMAIDLGIEPFGSLVKRESDRQK